MLFLKVRSISSVGDWCMLEYAMLTVQLISIV